MDEYQTKEFRNGAIRNPLILKDGGLSHTSVSTFFLRRLEQHAHGAQPRRPWLKWLIVVDVQQQILLAQRDRKRPGCDARAMAGLVDVVGRRVVLGVVLAGAAIDCKTL